MALICYTYDDLSRKKADRPYRTPEFDTNGFLNTKLYRYYQQNLDHELLTEIFSITNISAGLSKSQLLYDAYARLIEISATDVIYEIMDGTNCDDNSAICLAAIYSSNYDTLAELFYHGFDIQNIILRTTADFDWMRSLDCLSCAVLKNDLDMCKFLIDNGAKLLVLNSKEGLVCSALSVACQTPQVNDIMDYFWSILPNQVGDPYPTLSDILAYHFTQINGIMKVNHTKRMIEMGLDFNSLNLETQCTLLYKADGMKISLLRKHGLELKTDFFPTALGTNNLTLLRLLLEEGLSPDTETLREKFPKMTLDTLCLLAAYSIDLSVITYDCKYDHYISGLEDSGLPAKVLLNRYIQRELDERAHFVLTDVRPKIDL